MVLNHRSRKSGKPHQAVVNAYRKGNIAAILLGHGKTGWVKTWWLPVRRPPAPTAADFRSSRASEALASIRRRPVQTLRAELRA
jgi:hypothetical protein